MPIEEQLIITKTAKLMREPTTGFDQPSSIDRYWLSLSRSKGPRSPNLTRK
jgi:hypothetical protein